MGCLFTTLASTVEKDPKVGPSSLKPWPSLLNIFLLSSFFLCPILFSLTSLLHFAEWRKIMPTLTISSNLRWTTLECLKSLLSEGHFCRWNVTFQAFLKNCDTSCIQLSYIPISYSPRNPLPFLLFFSNSPCFISSSLFRFLCSRLSFLLFLSAYCSLCRLV